MHRSVLCALKSEGRSCGLRDKRIWNLGGGGPGSWFHSQLTSNPRPPSIAEVKPHKKPKFQLTASDPGGHGWGGWVAGWVGYSRLAPSGGCFSLLFWFLGTRGAASLHLSTIIQLQTSPPSLQGCQRMGPRSSVSGSLSIVLWAFYSQVPWISCVCIYF